MAKNEANEKIKPIVLTEAETGKEYVLEFSRESVKFAEARGFKISEVAVFPVTLIPDFFYYSFRKNHKNVSRAETDRILREDLGGLSQEAIERLSRLYMIPFEGLVRSEDDGEEKNARMTVKLL
jgi:hypothetical protein